MTPMEIQYGKTRVVFFRLAKRSAPPVAASVTIDVFGERFAAADDVPQPAGPLQIVLIEEDPQHRRDEVRHRDAARLEQLQQVGRIAMSAGPRQHHARAGQERQEQLTEQIRQSYEENRRVYGSPKVAVDLQEKGVKIDARGEYLRICPDFLNTAEELDQGAQMIRRLLGA